MRCAVLFTIAMLAPAAGIPPALAAPADDTAQAPAPTAIRTVEPNAVEAILGSAITDKSGKDMGRLVDVLVDADGVPQAGVIDFGGFLGVGARKVAVHWSTLHFTPGDGKHQIVLDMTPDEIKAAPSYSNPDKPAAVVTPTPVAGNAEAPVQAKTAPR